jgi:hypothetical protein
MTLTQTNLSVDLPCDLGHGHWTRKFLVQLGLGRGEAKPVERRQPKGSTVVLNQPVPQSKPIRVTVEDSTLQKCGFWVGFISGIVGLTQAIISLVH